MKKLSKAVLTGTFVALCVAGSTTAAQAATSAACGPTGFWESSTSAYYGHCSNTTVQIKIDYHDSTPARYACVGYGQYYLGSRTWVANAYWTGNLC